MFLISETRIDNSFPNAQFKIKGYKVLGVVFLVEYKEARAVKPPEFNFK